MAAGRMNHFNLLFIHDATDPCSILDEISFMNLVMDKICKKQHLKQPATTE